MRLGLRELFDFVIRERANHHVADAGPCVQRRRKPCAKRFKVLVARAHQDFPMAKAWLGGNFVYEIGDDPLVIRSNTVNSVDKKDRRPGRSNFLQKRNGVRV